MLLTFPNSSKNLKKINKKDSFGNLQYSHEYLKYDLSLNLLKESLINSQGEVEYKLDLLGRVKSINSKAFAQTATYDDIGRIDTISWKTSKSEDFCRYSYDDLNQITQETGLFANNYEYDSHFNRLKKNQDNYQINDVNEIVATSDLEFIYDKNGNPILRKTKDEEISYFYDALDRLIKIDYKDKQLKFIYDPLNRRLSKEVYKKIDGEVILADITCFLYDEQNEIGSFDRDKNPKELRVLSDSETAEIYSAISFEIGSNIYSPLYDISGNVACLLGDQFEQYRYSVFGERKIFDINGEEENSSLLNNPWQFSCKRIDEESKLIYFGRRYL